MTILNPTWHIINRNQPDPLELSTWAEPNNSAHLGFFSAIFKWAKPNILAILILGPWPFYSPFPLWALAFLQSISFLGLGLFTIHLFFYFQPFYSIFSEYQSIIIWVVEFLKSNNVWVVAFFL